MSDTKLYFAYTSLLAPGRISHVAPGARFQFTAHYPETRLAFVSNGNRTVPTLRQDPAHTVWGGVFSIPFDEVESIVRVEKEEGRVPGWDMKAIDRLGNKHQCLTFVGPDQNGTEQLPEIDYVNQIIKGARHWKLPAGWVVGLEDLIEDPLFG